MPIYQIVCKTCGNEDEVYRAIRDMDDLPTCHGKKMERLIARTNVIADIKPYRSTVTGEMITSRSQHREHLARHNLMEIGNEVEAHMKTQAGKKIKPRRKDDSRKRLLAEKLNSLL